MNRSCIKIVRLPRVWLSLALVFVTCGFSRPASAFAPCCVITSIDTHTAIVAARETGTGKTFSFKVTNPSLLNSLKVGQGVYANFSKGQVSADGFAPCCNIVNASGGTAGNSFGPIDGATSGKQFGPIDGAPAGKPLGPCCGITGIDARTGSVTAKEAATGKTFSFKAANPSLLNSLKIGQGVYANFSKGQVSVDGFNPCCNIVNASGGTAVNSFGPIDGATAGKQFGPIDGAQGGKPLTPCCSITGIDPRMSTVTAKETATGKTFSFKATNPSLLNSLKVGQAVYANFATRQVSVDGLEPCCSITVGAH